MRDINNNGKTTKPRKRRAKVTLRTPRGAKMFTITDRLLERLKQPRRRRPGDDRPTQLSVALGQWLEARSTATNAAVQERSEREKP